MDSLGHKKLAEFIFKQFSLLENRWNPHHLGGKNEIENFLYKVRGNFLKGKMYYCQLFFSFIK